MMGVRIRATSSQRANAFDLRERHRGLGGHLADVGPGRERPLAGTADHDRPDAVVAIELLEGRDERIDEAPGSGR